MLLTLTALLFSLINRSREEDEEGLRSDGSQQQQQQQEQQEKKKRWWDDYGTVENVVYEDTRHGFLYF